MQDDRSLEELVFTALGEASMCWSERPKGVFNDAEAKRIGEELIRIIRERATNLTQTLVEALVEAQRESKSKPYGEIHLAMGRKRIHTGLEPLEIDKLRKK